MTTTIQRPPQRLPGISGPPPRRRGLTSRTERDRQAARPDSSRLIALMGPANRAPGVPIMGRDVDLAAGSSVMGGPDCGPPTELMGRPDDGVRHDLLGESDPRFVDSLFTGDEG